ANDTDVAESDVFDRMVGNSDDQGAGAGFVVVHDDVADADASQMADGGAGRGVEAAGEAQEKRGLTVVAHGDVGDRDVFQVAAVHVDQRQAVTVIERTVGNGDVAEAADGFGAEFDSAHRSGVVVNDVANGGQKGAIQHRSGGVPA